MVPITSPTIFDKDAAISSLECSLAFFPLAKFDAVISGYKEPILLTASPISISRDFLSPEAAKSSISQGLLVSSK